MRRRPCQAPTLCASPEHQLAGADVHQQVLLSPVRLVMPPVEHKGEVQRHGLRDCGPKKSQSVYSNLRTERYLHSTLISCKAQSMKAQAHRPVIAPNIAPKIAQESTGLSSGIDRIITVINLGTDDTVTRGGFSNVEFCMAYLTSLLETIH